MSTKALLYKGTPADGQVAVYDAATKKWIPEDPAGGSGATGIVPAQAVTTGTSPNEETGTGTYVVNIISESPGYAFAFQREGDDFPFLAVTDVGDWVIGDGSYDPTSGPISFSGLQWSNGAIDLAGGGNARVHISSDDVAISGGALLLNSLDEPDAPLPFSARLFLRETSFLSGKMGLYVKFPTGAAQAIAIEP